MTLISQDITSFKGGVSQQPPILRFPDQLEEQINGYSSEVYGLQKRPPAILLGSLDVTNPDDLGAKWFTINRDVNERYFVRLSKGNIEVFDYAGKKYAVNFPDGKAYLTNGITNPETDFKQVTVADYTFIVNTKVTVEMDSSVTTSDWKNCTLYWCKTSNYGKAYSIRVNGQEVANMMTPIGKEPIESVRATTDVVAKGLFKSLNGDADAPSGSSVQNDWTYDNWIGTTVEMQTWGYTHWTSGSRVPAGTWKKGQIGASVIYLQRNDKGEFSTEIKDGYGGQALVVIQNEVSNINKLPVSAPDGYILKIAGRTSGSSDDDYYVKWDTRTNNWKECAGMGVKYHIKPSTMPWGLIREADGTFTFKMLTWDDREAGDEDSNPDPSFIGNTINDIFFYRNRLGLISGENIILSESASFFNFWFKSAAAVADTDVIDVAVSDTKVINLTHAIPFSRELILFSREGQFVLSSDGTMTPKSVKCDKITGFTYATNVAPINIGANIFFFNTRVDYGALMRFYTVQDVADLKDAEDTSGHVPSYLPKDVIRLSGNTTFDLVTLVNKSNEVYVYKYIIQNNQNIQQSWSKWDFRDTNKVILAEVIDDTIWVIRVDTVDNNRYYLEKLSLKNNIKDFSEEPYRCFLDHKIITNVPTGDRYYDDYHNTTSFSLSDVYSGYEHTNSSDAGYAIVDLNGYIHDFDDDTHVITLSGDWRGTRIVVGQKIESLYQLSTIKIKYNNGANGVISENEGRLQLRYFWFNFADSGVFSVHIRDVLRNQEYVYKSTSKYFSKSDNTIGSIRLHTGRFKFPVQRDAEAVSITVTDDNPLPLTLVSGGWEGLYVRRNQKM